MESGGDLLQLLHIIWRRKWIVGAIIIVAIGLAAFYSFFVAETIYEADVTLLIGKEESLFFSNDRYTKNDIDLDLKVVKTYEGIAKSRTVRHKAQELLPGGEFKQIKSIRVESRDATQLLTIKVSHLSPAGAAACADALAESCIQVVAEMLPASTLKILDKAERPRKPKSPSPIIHLLGGLLIGIIVSVGIAILLEYIKHPIASNKEEGTIAQ